MVLEQEVHPWESRTVPAEVKQVKRVYASDDGGQSWRPHGAIAGIHWPRLIRCASGVYVLGVARAGPSPGNPIVVSKMLDARGAVWSPAAAVTAGRGWGAMSSNTGADVSRGRITVAFEINPSMSHPPVATSTSAPVLLRSGGRARAAAWERPLVADVPVKSVRGFVDSIVVHASLPGLRKPLFFRVAGVDVEARVLRLRLERVTLLWLHKTLRLPAGTVLRAGAGRQQYSALDWVAMAMSADETQDLRRPASWTFVERGVGNPAALHAAAMRALFGLGGDATHAVRGAAPCSNKRVVRLTRLFVSSLESICFVSTHCRCAAWRWALTRRRCTAWTSRGTTAWGPPGRRASGLCTRWKVWWCGCETGTEV